MIEKELLEHGSFVYTAKGISMLPLLRERRDLIIISRRSDARLKKYDTVLFRRDNGDYVLHRIIKVQENGYIICGDNLEQMEPVREEQVLGVLTEIVRDGKKIQVTDASYLFYVHFWWDAYPVRFLYRRTRYILGKAKKRLLKR